MLLLGSNTARAGRLQRHKLRRRYAIGLLSVYGCRLGDCYEVVIRSGDRV